jgi:hypothetical protein
MSNKLVSKVAIVTFLAMLALMIMVSAAPQYYTSIDHSPRIAVKPTE